MSKSGMWNGDDREGGLSGYEEWNRVD